MIVPVLTKVEVAKDASTITIKDSTGAYSASNTGGYGAPNAIEPVVVGFRVRYWPDTDPYGHLVTEDSTLLAALFGSGLVMTTGYLGSTAEEFTAGVHHIKYYPLYITDTVVTLTKDSKLVTVTAGTAPTVWDSTITGLMFKVAGTNDTKVFIVDRTQAITSTTFYLTEAWTDDTVAGVELWSGPEADLKVLVSETANKCVVERIGKLGDACTCNEDEEDLLIRYTMQLFSAQVNFDCLDYSGAHNKIVGIYAKCNDCKTTCSCS